MTIAEMMQRVKEILAGLKYGEIRITVRNGEPKHVNVLQEYKLLQERDKTDSES